MRPDNKVPIATAVVKSINTVKAVVAVITIRALEAVTNL